MSVPAQTESNVNDLGVLALEFVRQIFASELPLEPSAVQRSQLSRSVEGEIRLARDLLRAKVISRHCRCQQTESLGSVLLELQHQGSVLQGVDEGRLAVVPLASAQNRRESVGDMAERHEGEKLLRQSLTDQGRQVLGDRAIGQRLHLEVRQVEDRAVGQQRLAHAVPVNVVVLHLLSGEGVHPVCQWHLLDEVHRRLEREIARSWLEVVQVQVRVGEAVLGSC